ncbi:hypothetical protein ACBR19_20425 [Raoultella planticola]
MDGGGTVTGKSLAANAQETLEASKVTAIKKRPFNGISSKLTDSPSFLRKFSFQIRVYLQENMTRQKRRAANALLMPR